MLISFGAGSCNTTHEATRFQQHCSHSRLDPISWWLEFGGHNPHLVRSSLRADLLAQVLSPNAVENQRKSLPHGQAVCVSLLYHTLHVPGSFIASTSGALTLSSSGRNVGCSRYFDVT